MIMPRTACKLRVLGRIEHIVLGVSASLGLIDEAARLGADVVLVHHGWFWKGESPRLLVSRGVESDI